MPLLHKLIGVAALALTLAACSPEVLPPSGPHPQLAPDAIKIYQNQPQKYERLGMIILPLTPEYRWDERGEAQAAFNKFKATAAAQGANGILLMDDSGQATVTVGAGYHGTFYMVPVNNGTKTAYAQAIFVINE
jgi:hypothetical protein